MAGRVAAPPPGPQPPMMQVRPPAPGIPPPAPAAAAAARSFDEAPPPPKPTINVAARYREIGTIRLFAMVFMFIAAAISRLSAVLADPDLQLVTMAGMGLTAVAVVFGLIAIINQRNRRLNNISTITAASLMIAGMAAQPAVLTLGKVSMGDTEFILAILFAVFYLLFLEYTHAVRRFWEIGEMAIEKNLKDFDFGHVLRQYIVMGFMWLVVAIIITIGVVGFQMAMQLYLPPQLGQSAEMRSVYGLAIAEGVIFVLLGLVLSFVLGRKEYAQSFRAVGTRAPPRPAGPTTAQVVQLGQTATPSGLSATAPPPRAQ